METVQVSGNGEPDRPVRTHRQAYFDCEAPDEAALLKVTGPFSSLGVAHVAPAMPLEEAIQVPW
ncbi:MAG: hypothetical protein ACLPI9_04775 [Halobacteriota archaeon]